MSSEQKGLLQIIRARADECRRLAEGASTGEAQNLLAKADEWDQFAREVEIQEQAIGVPPLLPIKPHMFRRWPIG